MEIIIPKGVSKILERFQDAGYEIYIVGGATRDILTAKDVYDWDFTTNATPEQMLALFDSAYYENSFGMVGIPNETDGQRPYEITTYRTEYGYSDSRRPDKVLWGNSLEEDVKRRDFTINAMALQLVKTDEEKPNTSQDTTSVVCQMNLIDHHGGQEDLNKKIIRTVGDPVERFNEDSLRMMRAIRIATEIGFEIEENTLEAISKNATLINKISPERIRDEFLKILASKNPDVGILMLKSSNILREILPELEENFGVAQASPGRHHVYDVGTHSVLSLKYVSEKNSDPIVRLATLIHDLGKAKTYKKLETGTITFYNHELFSARIAKKLAERMRLSNSDRDKLWTLVRFHQFTLDERQTDSAIRRFIRNVGKDNVKDMIDLRVGDRLGGGARETSWRLEEFKNRVVEVQKQPFSIQDLKISGFDVMKITGIKSGPGVGQTLKKIFDEVLNGKVKNTKADLLKRLHGLLDKQGENL